MKVRDVINYIQFKMIIKQGGENMVKITYEQVKLAFEERG